jgi:hypothetical protein
MSYFLQGFLKRLLGYVFRDKTVLDDSPYNDGDAVFVATNHLFFSGRISGDDSPYQFTQLRSLVHPEHGHGLLLLLFDPDERSPVVLFLNIIPIRK